MALDRTLTYYRPIFRKPHDKHGRCLSWTICNTVQRRILATLNSSPCANWQPCARNSWIERRNRWNGVADLLICERHSRYRRVVCLANSHSDKHAIIWPYAAGNIWHYLAFNAMPLIAANCGCSNADAKIIIHAWIMHASFFFALENCVSLE